MGHCTYSLDRADTIVQEIDLQKLNTTATIGEETDLGFISRRRGAICVVTAIAVARDVLLSPASSRMHMKSPFLSLNSEQNSELPLVSRGKTSRETFFNCVHAGCQ